MVAAPTSFAFVSSGASSSVADAGGQSRGHGCDISEPLGVSSSVAVTPAGKAASSLPLTLALLSSASRVVGEDPDKVDSLGGPAPSVLNLDVPVKEYVPEGRVEHRDDRFWHVAGCLLCRIVIRCRLARYQSQ